MGSQSLQRRIRRLFGCEAYVEQTGEMTIRVTNCLREYDVSGRYGGEEFLVFVPDSDLKSTKVAASFGITSCQGFTGPINVTLQCADEALYKAKEEGRDRVVGFE